MPSRACPAALFGVIVWVGGAGVVLRGRLKRRKGLGCFGNKIYVLFKTGILCEARIMSL